MIDNNGYIIISEQNMTDTGRFFGEVEKPIMESMLYANIFKKLTIYDLQGLCRNVTEIKDPDDQNAAATGLMTVRQSQRLNQTPSFINISSAASKVIVCGLQMDVN